MEFTNGTPNNLNGFSHEAPSRPLNVTIVDAGIGGLSAAIFLRQQGHTVTLLEASRFANELGAAIHLAPNANGLLRRMGLYPEDKGAVHCRKITGYFPDGSTMLTIDASKSEARWQHPWQLAHRVSLHSELKRLATCEEGKGKPATLRLRSRVASVDPKTAVVTLESGEKIESDVVIGADGVHSQTRRHLPGAENIKPFPGDKSAYRFMVDAEKVLADPMTRKFGEPEGNMIMVYGKDRRVVVYPTSDNKLLNCAIIHPANESQANPGSTDWQNEGNLQKMLELYKDFEPAILKLLSMADEETLKVWALLDMDKLPTWTEGKMALIGDAAHPFTPHQGQGAAQAIEDAASLAVMLPSNTPLDSIPDRLKLYEKCRYERAHNIQEFSRRVGKDIGKESPPDAYKFNLYNYAHDEWHHSSQALREWEWSKKQGLLWRMPTAFGPMPGPRQDFEGRPRDGSKAKFTTTSVKFKSSKTVLQNLLPTKSLKFAEPDTVVYATFSVTQLDNLEWLGGRGYNHFGLYVHGVQHTREDGETATGTYLPVLFESLADPILSGREELGFPKLFAELDVKKTNEEWALEAGWMGSKFCNLTLSGLQEASAANGEAPAPFPPLPKDEGLLLSKYVPASGSLGSKERGRADVEYTTFVPHAEDAKSVERKVQRTIKASSAKIKFDALDWKALPTLHHIIERLEEIPVYEVIEAKIVEGTGVSDVSCVRKLA